MSGRAKAVDWQAIERDYRAGVSSLREMAALHGINHVSIKKRADKDGWARDLAAKIQARANAIVNKAVANRSANTVIDLASERETVEAVGGAVANVKLKHRSHATRLGAVNESLLAELDFLNTNAAQLVAWAALIRDPNEFGVDRQNDMLIKILSLPNRVDTAKKLAEAMNTGTNLERKSWNMDEKGADPVKASDIFTSLLLGMRQSALPVVHEVERDENI